MFTGVWAWIVVCIVSYLLGAFSGSIFSSKTLFQKDVRDYGSSNAGLTNAIRNFGWKAGVITCVIDVLKTLAALFFATWMVGHYGIIASGILVCIGHAYPVYYKFKGGKCAVCSITILFFLSWKVALVIVAIFAIVLILTKKVSLGSMTGAIASPFAVWAFLPTDIYFILFAVVIALFVIFLHRSNIKRLVDGTENEVSKKTK